MIDRCPGHLLPSSPMQEAAGASSDTPRAASHASPRGCYPTSPASGSSRDVPACGTSCMSTLLALRSTRPRPRGERIQSTLRSSVGKASTRRLEDSPNPPLRLSEHHTPNDRAPPHEKIRQTSTQRARQIIQGSHSKATNTKCTDIKNIHQQSSPAGSPEHGTSGA